MTTTTMTLTQWVIDITVLQYILLCIPIVLVAGVLVYHFYQLSIGETRDKIFKDGIKAVMQRDIKNGN